MFFLVWSIHIVSLQLVPESIRAEASPILSMNRNTATLRPQALNDIIISYIKVNHLLCKCHLSILYSLRHMTTHVLLSEHNIRYHSGGNSLQS